MSIISWTATVNIWTPLHNGVSIFYFFYLLKWKKQEIDNKTRNKFFSIKKCKYTDEVFAKKQMYFC